MQDFTHKNVLKPRDCIHLELLETHDSQLEAGKTHKLIEMRNSCLKRDLRGEKKNKTIIWASLEEKKITSRPLIVSEE